MTRESLSRAAPLLLEIAEMTLDLFEKGGLKDATPEAARFTVTLKRVIEMAKRDPEEPCLKSQSAAQQN